LLSWVTGATTVKSKREIVMRIRKTPDQLRSARWFAPDDLRSFGHRSRAKQMGFAREEFSGRPVIGIVNTWNGFNTCPNSHLIRDVRPP